MNGGDPRLERCEIRDNMSIGVSIQHQGRGLFVLCNIHSNTRAGVGVSKGLGLDGNPRFERCIIHHTRAGFSEILKDDIGAGVLVVRGGAGQFHQCQVSDNFSKDWDIRDEANPQID